MLRNDTPCKVTSYSGVAYAYNAVGRPVKANKGGEPYVAFTSAAVEGGVSIEKGAKYIHSQGMKYPEGASLGVAHVDAYQCEDGTKWARASL
jgi:hypothetical protein